jgi:hypothetical protein
MARGDPGEEIYRPQVQPEDLPRKIVPEDRGGPDPLGAVAQVATQTTDIMQKKQAADTAAWAGNTLADFRVAQAQKLEQMKAAAPAGDPGNFTERWAQQYDQDAQKLAAVSQSNPMADAMVRKGLGDMRRAFTEHVIGWEATQRKASQADSIEQNLQAQLGVVRAHPELADSIGSTLNDQIQTRFDGDPSQKLQYLRRVDQSLTGAAAQGLLDQDPVHVYRELKADSTSDPVLSRVRDPQMRQQLLQQAGTGIANQLAGGVTSALRMGGPAAGAQAFAAIDKAPWDDEIKEKAIQEAHRQRATLIEENQTKYDAQLTSVRQQIASGQYRPDFDSTVAMLHDKVAVSGEQAGAWLGEHARAAAKLVDTDTHLQDFQDVMDGKRYFDPKDKDSKMAADVGYQRLLDQNHLEPLSADGINLAAHIATKGAVPDTAAVAIRSVLVASQDPQQFAAAAGAVSRLRDASPRAFQYLEDHEHLGQMADAYLDLTKNGGIDPATALQTVRANEEQTPERRKLLDRQFAFARPFGPHEGALEQELRQQLHDIPALEGHGTFLGLIPTRSVPDVIPPEMTAAYGKNVRAIWERNGGNIADAEKAAAASLGRAWGVTAVNGTPEIWHLPPERMWADVKDKDGNPIITPQLIREDIAKHAQGAPGIEPYVIRRWNDAKNELETFKPDPDKIKLKPIPATDLTGGRRFGVFYDEHDDGHLEDLRDEKNRPLTYDLPVTGTDLQTLARASRDEQAKRDAAAVAKASADRQATLQHIEDTRWGK